MPARLGRGPSASLLAVCLLGLTVAVRGDQIDTMEMSMSIQAAYLYQFTRFVEWPAADKEAPLVVCVVGRDPFGETLDLAVEGRRGGGRRVTVRRLPDVETAAACSLVFLPAGEAGRLPQLQQALGKAPVLLVSDAPGFARNGGMIGFFRDADRVRCEVNPAAAEGAGLRISSRLLGSARVVGSAAGGGR